MGSYTMQLREYAEMLTQGKTLSIRDTIEKARTLIFDFDYPIFDPTYKKVFETHFIRKFYMREIGFETEGLFKFNLETWLLINMPYFNKLFESELLEYDPLTNAKMDVTTNKKNDKTQSQNAAMNETSNQTSTKDANGTSTEDNFDRQLESTNPDTRLTLTATDGEGVIEYASSINENNENNSSSSTSHATASNDNTSNATSNVNGSINETEDYVQSRVGKIGVQSYGKLITDYRDALLRVENKIFEEMQELFMLVY